jgi:tripartite-type tricarboxylate transporter receptor subunit TctC
VKPAARPQLRHESNTTEESLLLHRRRKTARNERGNREELMNRLRACCAAIVVAMAALDVPAHAQKLSDRPITIVVPTTAGTSMDFLARIAADDLKQRWDQTVVVENKPGASHTIAIQAVARAQPDGLTLLSAANTLTTNVGFFKVMPYDPVNSLTPVVEMARGQLALAVNPSVPARSLAELVAYAKQRPGEVNFASTGPGTPQHLAMEFLSLRAGVKMVHVPYPGSANAVRELVGGFVQAMFVPSHQAMPLAEAKSIRLLAFSGKSRLPQAPDVPTLAEAGFSGIEVDSWYGLLGPAGMPKETTERLNRAVNDMLVEPKLKAAFAAQGLVPVGGSPAEFRDLIAQDVERWTKVVKEAGIETK